MENASKALVMAGSILISLLTIGALIFMFDSISGVEMQKDQNAEIEETLKFNRQFEAFDTVGLRGTDILSIMNKMANYNETNDVETQGYEPMTMNVTFSTAVASVFSGTKELEYDINTKKTKGDLYDIIQHKRGSVKIEATGVSEENLKEFKRKYFKCTKIDYDNKTGRVIRMEFKEIDVH